MILSSGAKAILLKDSKEQFYLAVMAANRKLNSKEFKKLIKAKSTKFATNEEVLLVTGCIPGAVPPFGSMFNKKITTYVDKSLSENKMINFNCGLRTHSISISFSDY